MGVTERERAGGRGGRGRVPATSHQASLGDSAKSTAGPCVMSQPQQPVTRAEAGRRCTQPPLKLSHTKRGSSLAALLQDGGGRRGGGGAVGRGKGSQGHEMGRRESGGVEAQTGEKERRHAERGRTRWTRPRPRPARCSESRWRDSGGAPAAERPSCLLGHRPIKAGTPILTHHHPTQPPSDAAAIRITTAKTSRRSRQTQIKGRASAAARPQRCPRCLCPSPGFHREEWLAQGQRFLSCLRKRFTIF